MKILTLMADPGISYYPNFSYYRYFTVNKVFIVKS